MYVFCVYPAMSKKSENLSDLNKKDRNKRHSSPFIRKYEKFIRLVRIQQIFIHIAYLYSKCTDCRIKQDTTEILLKVA